MIGQPKIICDYVAHAMGTNAIITVPITSTTTNNQNDDTVYSWDLVICSAGDDQSVTAQQMQVSIAWEEKVILTQYFEILIVFDHLDRLPFLKAEVSMQIVTYRKLSRSCIDSF